MNLSLQRLVDVLELEWTDRQLHHHLTPYRLGDHMAEGSMALVFEAIDGRSGSAVVLKFPSSADVWGRLSDWSLCERIETLSHEAQWLRAARRYGIDGVVGLLDDRTHSSLPFLVLEKVDGQSLGELIGDSVPFDLDSCLIALRDVAAILESLHAAGLHHYDVKPDNLLLADNRWTLIDPAAQSTRTAEYSETWIDSGPARDILALGRTFLAMYLGYEGEVDVPDGYDLEDFPTIFNLAKRMLGRSRFSIPTATNVRRVVSRVLAREFGIASPRFPVRQSDWTPFSTPGLGR